jgi:ribosomal-protein-alanine N-acetyltransferase
VTLRPAISGDAERIVGLEADLFGADAWSARTVAETLATRTVLVAEQGRRLDGYVVLRVVDGVADLERIAVRPERQRSGLATDLLAEACAAVGADRVLLEVSADNAAAIGFYRRTGFTEIDRRRAYYRDGTDALVMCRGEV